MKKDSMGSDNDIATIILIPLLNPQAVTVITSVVVLIVFGHRLIGFMKTKHIKVLTSVRDWRRKKVKNWNSINVYN